MRGRQRRMLKGRKKSIADVNAAIRVTLHDVEEVRICGDPTYVKNVNLGCVRRLGKSKAKKQKQKGNPTDY